MTTGSLEGLRLFLVEDEALVAMLLEDMLSDLGCVVVDIAGSLSEALGRLDGIGDRADGAILDVNLGGEQVYPFADALADCKLPFLFATGYGRMGVSARYPSTPVLAKPYGAEELAAALSTISGRQ
ncbi:MAG: response regulator [Caulobacter sp.]|nr:response regulator [Caulobacter sp.]